jgi:hypothetical protein
MAVASQAGHDRSTRAPQFNLREVYAREPAVGEVGPLPRQWPSNTM